MKLSIGKELKKNGYKFDTFFFEHKVKRTTYFYEYTVFMERVDTFKQTTKVKADEFRESMKEQGYKIFNWI